MIRLRLQISAYSVLALALTCVSASSSAQTSSGVKPAESQLSSKTMMNVPVQIASGDLLEISVFDAPELTQQVRVGSDGNVQLALIGDTKLAGLTGQQAAGVIADALRNRKLMLHPQVNVLVKETSSQGVSVMGEVQHPGIYQILGTRSLIDVISMVVASPPLPIPGLRSSTVQGRKITLQSNSRTTTPMLRSSMTFRSFPET